MILLLSVNIYQRIKLFWYLSDIPLVPKIITGDPDREPNFVLHWLNNKEMHFSLQAENILQV